MTDTMQHRVERRGRTALAWAASDTGAIWAFRIALAISALVYWVVGRRQWFIRDDWAFLLSRQALRVTRGIDDWLLTAQDGHWMTPPLLIFRGLQNLFGMGSYWPYLVVNLVLHVGAVLLTRRLCQRWGVSPWTTTLLCSILLVFGGGWMNIVFAVQITYNLSLVCFLAQVLLADHDGPVDRRDWLGAALGVLGVMSSGFGPFFIAGMAALLVLRGRWKAAAIAVLPQGLAYAWWYLTWASDIASDTVPGPRSQVPAFAVRGLTATFESLIAIPALGAVALLGALAMVFTPALSRQVRAGLAAMWVTSTLMFLGIGVQRIGFGVQSAEESRYQYMAAMVLVPAVGLAVDRLARWSPGVHRATQVLLAVSVVLNAGWLQVRGAEWADRSAATRRLFELVAGSGLLDDVAPDRRIDDYNPDVNAGWLGYLVREGVVTPRTPSTPEEIAEVRRALGLP
jgi:hypothetical protein